MQRGTDKHTLSKHIKFRTLDN